VSDRDVLDARVAELSAGIDALGRWGWRRIDVQRAVAVNGTAVQADLVTSLASDAVDGWLARHRLSAIEAVAAVVGVGALLRRFGSIPAVDDGDAVGVDPAVLARVRALLAKAESTTFEAEAEALVAKAHELMVRHAIDSTTAASADEPVLARRVFLADPYQRAKFLLLAEVARASSCRALLSTNFGFATVFGHTADLDAVELLYTSLLLQATNGVVLARPTGPRPPASQVAAYRRAWLVAFGQRVGVRLRAATASAVDDATATHGPSLLPVLAAREAAVEAKLREAAPQVRSLRTTVSSREGWRAGAAAGDRASLSGTAPLPTRPGALPRSGA
jgi:hypothetical protein